MKILNEMKVTFKAMSENESFARLCVAGFCAYINPSIDEINDMKTAVSEAVTNCVVHAYPNVTNGIIEMSITIYENEVYITITDFGVGISDVNKARQPFYTTKTDSERSGMGFTVMEGFMDKVIVESKLGKGTSVTLLKQLEGDCKIAIGS